MELKIWKRPRRDADVLQSMHDALLDMPKGDGLVYYEGLHLPELSVEGAAARQLQKFGSLVQQATAPIDRTRVKQTRIFRYILQRK